MIASWPLNDPQFATIVAMPRKPVGKVQTVAGSLDALAVARANAANAPKEERRRPRQCGAAAWKHPAATPAS